MAKLTQSQCHQIAEALAYIPPEGALSLTSFGTAGAFMLQKELTTAVGLLKPCWEDLAEARGILYSVSQFLDEISYALEVLDTEDVGTKLDLEIKIKEFLENPNEI